MEKQLKHISGVQCDEGFERAATLTLAAMVYTRWRQDFEP